MVSAKNSGTEAFRSNLKLLLTGEASVATGDFDHLGWNLRTGGEDNSWTSLVASLHETCHFDLNQSTGYGALLMAQAYLTRELATPRQMLRLRDLTEKCRNCHETFATLQSLMIAADAGVTRDMFIDTYPDYQDWLEEGEALISGLNSQFARMAALAAVIKGCFQTPVIAMVSEIGLDSYAVDDLPLGEFPDQRLKTLAPLLTKAFWRDNLSVFFAQETNKTASEHLRQAEGTSPDAGHADQALTSIEFEPFSVALSGYFETRISEAFGQLSLGHLMSSQYQTYCQPLLDQCDALAPFTQATSTLRLPSSNRGSDFDALDVQLSETLIIGPAFTARVSLFDESPRTDWDHYISICDGHEVIFLASRTKERFLQQYQVDDSGRQTLDQIPQDYLVYMVKLIKTGDQNVVDICLFSKPGQILVIDRILKRGMVASTSMLLLSDKDWQEHWHDAIAKSATQIILFDLSPLDHLTRSLDVFFEQIAYKKYQIELGKREVACLVFVGTSSSPTSIFCAPCSDVVANGIIHHIETDKNLCEGHAAKWLEGDPAFETLEQALTLILGAIFLHERSFDFKALQSEFGSAGFRNKSFLTEPS